MADMECPKWSMTEAIALKMSCTLPYSLLRKGRITKNLLVHRHLWGTAALQAVWHCFLTKVYNFSEIGPSLGMCSSGVVDWSAISKASGTFCWVTKTMPKLSKRQANNRKTEAYIIKKARTIQDKALMSSSCVFYFSNWEGLELWSHLRVLLPVLGSGLLLRRCLQSWTAGNFGISKVCPNSSPRFQPVSCLKGSDEDHLNLAMITPCSSATPKLKWHLSFSIICWWDIKLPRTLLLPDT